MDIFTVIGSFLPLQAESFPKKQKIRIQCPAGTLYSDGQRKKLCSDR